MSEGSGWLEITGGRGAPVAMAVETSRAARIASRNALDSFFQFADFSALLSSFRGRKDARPFFWEKGRG